MQALVADINRESGEVTIGWRPDNWDPRTSAPGQQEAVRALVAALRREQLASRLVRQSQGDQGITLVIPLTETAQRDYEATAKRIAELYAIHLY